MIRAINEQSIYSKQTAFTFLEVLIGVSILAILFLSLTATTIHCVKLDQANQENNFAYRLAKQQMEFLKTLPFNDLKSMVNKTYFIKIEKPEDMADYNINDSKPGNNMDLLKEKTSETDPETFGQFGRIRVAVQMVEDPMVEIQIQLDWKGTRSLLLATRRSF